MTDVASRNVISFRSAVIEMVGENAIESPDYGRIINDRHMARLANIIEKMPREKLVFGGEMNASEKFIGRCLKIWISAFTYWSTGRFQLSAGNRCGDGNSVGRRISDRWIASSGFDS